MKKKQNKKNKNKKKKGRKKKKKDFIQMKTGTFRISSVIKRKDNKRVD